MANPKRDPKKYETNQDQRAAKMVLTKKGSLQDVLLLTILAFMLSIGGLFSIMIFKNINTQLQSQDGISTEAKSMLNTMDVKLPKWLDGAFIFFYVCFVILGLFLAFQIPTNPSFFPISIIYFVLLTFISKILSVIYGRMAAAPSMASAAATLGVIPYMMDKLPIFSFVIGVLIIGIMVIKR